MVAASGSRSDAVAVGADGAAASASAAKAATSPSARAPMVQALEVAIDGM